MQRILLLALVVILIGGLLAGCGQDQPSNQEGQNDGAKQGEKQDEILSGTITIAGSTSVQPLSEELRKVFEEKHPDVTIYVQGGGSSAGVKAAANGTADIGAASRKLKESEKEYGLTVITIARDGIAIAVHPSNPVEGMSLEEVRKVYTGEITNWKQLGGKDAPIEVVTREEGSGTRGAFEELVMEDSKITDNAIVQPSNGAVRTTVASSENAIGFISVGFLNDEVKGLKIDGVEPTAENIVAGKYPLFRPFNYLVKGEPKGIVKAYIDFVLSEEGQKIVAKDYIPVK